MIPNNEPTKAPVKLVDRFIEDTLDRLSNIEARLKAAEGKVDVVLNELQVREYVATNRHGPGDHTFTIPPYGHDDNVTVLPFDKTKA
jgi:hypothetical protein